MNKQPLGEIKNELVKDHTAVPVVVDIQDKLGLYKLVRERAKQLAEPYYVVAASLSSSERAVLMNATANDVDSDLERAHHIAYPDCYVFFWDTLNVMVKRLLYWHEGGVPIAVKICADLNISIMSGATILRYEK